MLPSLLTLVTPLILYSVYSARRNSWGFWLLALHQASLPLIGPSMISTTKIFFLITTGFSLQYLVIICDWDVVCIFLLLRKTSYPSPSKEEIDDCALLVVQKELLRVLKNQIIVMWLMHFKFYQRGVEKTFKTS